jgi:hypothetical protein
MSILLEKFKGFFSALGVILMAVLGVFFLGRNSAPKKLTVEQVDKARKEVKDEQKNKTVFQKLDDLDDSINRP